MKILMASSEVFPYSKTGGLADMTAALAKTLAAAGHQVGLVTPLYAGIQERFPDLARLDWKMNLPLGAEWVSATVFTCNPAPNLTVYFIAQPSLYERKDLYLENGQEFPDNARRFIFYAKAVTHLARYLPWQPELVHLHDWQTALVPLFIRYQALLAGWHNSPATCLTIHNLAYQGVYPHDSYRQTNLPWEYFHAEGAEYYGRFSFLKTGLVFVDQITAVSPTYAREIQTPEQGCGLEGLLRRRNGVLTGILNGADYDDWNTTHNPCLEHPYDVQHLYGKKAEKKRLQKELGLAVAEGVPLFGNIGRLADQKGVDILIGALEEMLDSEMQFVSLGSGAAIYERALRDLHQRFPDKVVVRTEYNHALAHHIEAACDFFLMPSRYEPCGLNQMYSLRYGTIPIVRATGGLADSVIDLRESKTKANGIKFHDYSSLALAKAMLKGMVVYRTPPLLQRMRQNGMKADFSWQATASHYLEVYQKALS